MDDHRCWAKGTQVLKRAQKGHSCTTVAFNSTTKKWGLSSARTVLLGTAQVTFLGFSFWVARAEHFPSVHPPPSLSLPLGNAQFN